MKSTDKQTLLIVGSGAREHALAWKLSQSPRVDRIIVAPGNEGMPHQWERWPISLTQGIPAFDALASQAKQQKVDLTVIGPDNALADGIVDRFQLQGLRVFGPTAQAAQIESSKSFAKKIMTTAGVPTATYWVIHNEAEGRALLQTMPHQLHWVIKADGLAFGKGVRICDSHLHTLEAIHALFQISKTLILEEKLIGKELSCMAFCDGHHCAILEPAQDYKALQDRDQGPNTGGMGAFSPVPGLPIGFNQMLQEQVFKPTLNEMKRCGMPFKGLLFAGIMRNPVTNQFWVLEFNARFGDPETQVLMPRLQGDLLGWLDAVVDETLQNQPSIVPFNPVSAVYVVAAAPGYPEAPQLGSVIAGLPNLHPALNLADPSYFYSGIHLSPDRRSFLTGGGRVLGALGIDTQDLTHARSKAYHTLQKISFTGMQFRSDIGLLERTKAIDETIMEPHDLR